MNSTFKDKKIGHLESLPPRSVQELFKVYRSLGNFYFRNIFFAHNTHFISSIFYFASAFAIPLFLNYNQTGSTLQTMINCFLIAQRFSALLVSNILKNYVYFFAVETKESESFCESWRTVIYSSVKNIRNYDLLIFELFFVFLIKFLYIAICALFMFMLLRLKTFSVFENKSLIFEISFIYFIYLFLSDYFQNFLDGYFRSISSFFSLFVVPFIPSIVKRAIEVAPDLQWNLILPILALIQIVANLLIIYYQSSKKLKKIPV